LSFFSVYELRLSVALLSDGIYQSLMAEMPARWIWTRLYESGDRNRSIGGLKAVANPPLSNDELGVARIDLKHTAQVSNVDVQDSGIVSVICLPDPTKQLVSWYGFPSPSHQQSHDLAADWAQLVENTINLEPLRPGIQ
jgi:hypothetical protein